VTRVELNHINFITYKKSIPGVDFLYLEVVEHHVSTLGLFSVLVSWKKELMELAKAEPNQPKVISDFLKVNDLAICRSLLNTVS
jgi:hypothetical protein